jgi:hypothetical protein
MADTADGVGEANRIRMETGRALVVQALVAVAGTPFARGNAIVD